MKSNREQSVLEDDDKKIIQRKRIDEHWLTLVEAISNGIEEIDINGTILFANHALHEMFEVPEGKLIGRSIKDFSPQEEKEELSTYIEYLVKELPSNSQYIGKKITTSGKVIDVQIDWDYLFDEQDQLIGFISFIMDITDKLRQEKRERELIAIEATAEEAKNRIAELDAAYKELKETQSQLVQAGKLSALGALGTGIAHELNQPLTGILNFSKMALQDLEPENLLAKDLTIIHDQAMRMSRIIQNIVTFARPEEISVSPIDIQPVIDDTLSLIETQLHDHSIDVIQELPVDFPHVLGQPGRLQQVLLNLFINARDAIDELPSSPGGTIRIQGNVKGLNIGTPYKVELIISDNGVDIPEEMKDRLFEPFFTSKPEGKGTGLGLSIIHGILRDLEGSIQYRKGENGEKQFVIELKSVAGYAGKPAS